MRLLLAPVRVPAHKSERAKNGFRSNQQIKRRPSMIAIIPSNIDCLTSFFTARNNLVFIAELCVAAIKFSPPNSFQRFQRNWPFIRWRRVGEGNWNNLSNNKLTRNHISTSFPVELKSAVEVASSFVCCSPPPPMPGVRFAKVLTPHHILLQLRSHHLSGATTTLTEPPPSAAVAMTKTEVVVVGGYRCWKVPSNWSRHRRS